MYCHVFNESQCIVKHTVSQKNVPTLSGYNFDVHSASALPGETETSEIATFSL